MFDRFKQIVDQHLMRAIGLPPTQYDAIITVKGQTVTVLKISALTITSNFVGNFTELYHLTVAVPYIQNRMLLNRAYGDVQVKLLKKQRGKIVETINLRGVVLSSRDDDMESPTRYVAEADDKAFALAQLELMDEAFWKLRNVQVGNIYRKMTPLDVVRTVLSQTMPGNAIAHGQLQSIEYDEEEQTPYQCYSIPDSTEFMEFFDHIQNRFGVYSYGLGIFLQAGRWYLFRPYYPNKFQESKKKLVIYNLPKEQIGQLDESLDFTDNVRTIITGGQTRAFDYQDNNALNVGTGYRAGSIRSIDGRAVSNSPGKVAKTTPDKFVAQANPSPHDSGITNARVLENHFIDHDKKIRSDLAKQRGQIVQVTWHQAHRGVVFPGMGVKFMYSNEGQIYTRYGVVIGEVYHAALDGGSMASPQMNTVAELTLWISTEK